MYNLPVKVLKFLVNAVSDTVNTRANSLRWGKSTTSKCRHCDSVRHSTMYSIVVLISILSQGRYTWRHNNVLKCFVEMITESIRPIQKSPSHTPPPARSLRSLGLGRFAPSQRLRPPSFGSLRHCSMHQIAPF